MTWASSVRGRGVAGGRFGEIVPNPCVTYLKVAEGIASAFDDAIMSMEDSSSDAILAAINSKLRKFGVEVVEHNIDEMGRCFSARIQDA